MRSNLYFIMFIIFIAVPATGVQAEVYKHTNPDGSVEFSDVPDKKGAEPVEIQPSSSYEPPVLQPLSPDQTVNTGFAGYETASVTQPVNDTTIRDNTGNISVSVTSKPALQPNHSYVLLMDGNNVGEGRTGKFQLTNVDRGSHTLSVQIQDNEGNTLIQSDPVTFNLKRFSKLLKPGAP